MAQKPAPKKSTSNKLKVISLSVVVRNKKFELGDEIPTNFMTKEEIAELVKSGHVSYDGSTETEDEDENEAGE